MSNICYTSNKTALTDEERKGYEFNTTYHPETTTDDEVNRTNTSSYQENVNNQRRNKR